MASYPHMCRDDHVEIGHKDGEHEQCPLCRTIFALEFALECLEGGSFAKGVDPRKATPTSAIGIARTVLAQVRTGVDVGSGSKT